MTPTERLLDLIPTARKSGDGDSMTMVVDSKSAACRFRKEACHAHGK
jgi:hypothetical protein